MRGPISCLNAILDRWPALAAKFSATTLLAAKNILLHHGPVKFARTLHRGCDAQKAMGRGEPGQRNFHAIQFVGGGGVSAGADRDSFAQSFT